MKKRLINYSDNLVFGIIRNDLANRNLQYKKANVYVFGSKEDFEPKINTDTYIIKINISGFDENLIEEAIVTMSKAISFKGKGFSYSSAISSAWCKEEGWLEIYISHFLFYNIFEYKL